MASKIRSFLFALGFTTLGATAGITAGAIAGPHGARGGGGPMKFAMAMAGLDLSAEQQQMLSDLREEVKADRKASHDGKGDEVKAFSDAIVAGEDIDRAALHQRIDARALGLGYLTLDSGRIGGNIALGRQVNRLAGFPGILVEPGVIEGQHRRWLLCQNRRWCQ